MSINISIKPSNDLEFCEENINNIDLENYELAEEDELYVLISNNPEDPSTIFFKGGFYSIYSTNFKICYIDNETVIYDEMGSRLYSQPLANPGTIRSISYYKTSRCRPGYHKVCYVDGAGNRRCRCVPNN